MLLLRDAINPPGLPDMRQFYSQAIRTDGRTQVHCAGQVAVGPDGAVVGHGDVVAQCRQALANMGLALQAAGATPADVARIRIYVVGHRREYLAPISAEISRFFGDTPLPASTWLGVAALALPEFLIEIEVTAVLD